MRAAASSSSDPEGVPNEDDLSAAKELTIVWPRSLRNGSATSRLRGRR
jgi:hypothetical protein